MRLMKMAVLGCMVGLAGAGPARAGQPQERKGLWLGLGGGYGSANVTCDDCERSGREGSGTGFLKLGGTLNDRVLLGGEFNLWTKEQADVTLNLYNASATVTFYPRAASGFFLKGGAGFSFVDTEFREGSTTVTVDLGSGPGLIAGVGYDLRVGRKISLTPAVNYYWGNPGDLEFDGNASSTNWRQDVVELSLGITFH